MSECRIPGALLLASSTADDGPIYACRVGTGMRSRSLNDYAGGCNCSEVSYVERTQDGVLRHVVYREMSSGRDRRDTDTETASFSVTAVILSWVIALTAVAVQQRFGHIGELQWLRVQ